MLKPIILILAFPSIVLALVAGSALADRCETCHAKPEFKIQHKKLFDYYSEFQTSVHGVIGIGCVDCHGGDESSDDMTLAHEGVMDRVHYDRIPTTCGECHETQRDAFKGSKHFGILEDEGLAPNCVTCHGAMEMDFIFAGRVKTTCQFCHNLQTGTAPGVPDRAEYILNKINIIKGYKSFVALHGSDPEQVRTVKAAYGELTAYWHCFDFDQVEAATDELLATLRKAKAEALQARRR